MNQGIRLQLTSQGFAFRWGYLQQTEQSVTFNSVIHPSNLGK